MRRKPTQPMPTAFFVVWIGYMILAALAVWCSGCAKKPIAPVQAPPEIDLPDEPDSSTERARINPKEVILPLETPSFTFYFDFNASALKESEKAAQIAVYMAGNAKIAFLAGHTSQEGSSDYNMALGARRAQAVRAYLEAAGVPEHRIIWQSFGEEKPVTADPAKYHLNRRVEATLEDPQ